MVNIALNCVDLVLYTLSNQIAFGSVADRFFELLESFRGELTPRKIGFGEPLKVAYERKRAVEIWTQPRSSNGGGILFQGHKPYRFDGHVSWGGSKPDLLRLSVEAHFFESPGNIDKFLILAKNIYSLSEAFYGYIDHDLLANKHYTPGYSIMDCLGAIGWANFFGLPYVEFFGRDKLTKLPGVTTEELPDGGILVLTAETPLTVGDETVRKREQEVLEQLGKEAFYERSSGPKVYPAEKFIEMLLSEKKKVYKTPDFSKYLE